MKCGNCGKEFKNLSQAKRHADKFEGTCGTLWEERRALIEADKY